MSLNYLEIEKVIEAFPKHGIIKKCFQKDQHSLIINIFDGKKDNLIFASVKDRNNAVFIIPENENIQKEEFRFSQFLNANINGSRIKNIFQYNNNSRIVILELSSNGGVYKMIFRLWGNGGNIILTNEKNIVLECLRRMPGRGEWPDEEFIFPESKTPVKEFSIRPEFAVDDINEAVYRHFKNIFLSEETHSIKKSIEAILTKDIKESSLKLKNLLSESLENKEEIYLQHGEILKANIYKLKQGMDSVVLDDFNGNEKTIKLNKKLSPQENAKEYFEKYKKTKASKTHRLNDIKKLEVKLKELKYFEKLSLEINDLPKLHDLYTDIKKFLNIKKSDSSAEEKSPAKRFILDGGFTAYVSKSAKDSHELFKNYSKGNDWWFHIRDYPGSHVVVKKVKFDEITEAAKFEAAMLAVHFSKKRNAEDSDVYFTQVKYLHKSKSGPLGLVFPTQEKNIKVKTDKETLNKIFERG
jgi:predicted ribosome quality control (RQC) complex YloA/Tae2 family protein